jgi:membrane-associated phospholipid phosphatase
MAARRRRLWLTLAVSAATFGVLAVAVLFWERADELDVRFVRWVHEHAPSWLVEAMRVLTYLGGAWVLVPLSLLAAALLARRGRLRAALLVLCALALGQLLVQLLKLAVRRDRPRFPDPFLELSTFAFPSGHALGATATYGALALVLASAAAARERVALYVAAAAIVVVVAASRVVLGVHYLLDVVAGIAGGIALLAGLLLLLGPQTRR